MDISIKKVVRALVYATGGGIAGLWAQAVLPGAPTVLAAGLTLLCGALGFLEDENKQ